MEARKGAKLLAWLIALAVVFTMTLPSSVVWAAEDNASDNAAKIGDQEYATLQEAVDATEGDATIQMLKDVQEDVTIAEDDTITIDLNGKTITNVSGHTITNAGNLTVTGEGTVDNVTHAKGALVNTGTVILKGGTFTRSAEASKSPTDNGGNSWYVIDNQGKMTISDNAEIINNGYYSSLIRNMGSSAEKMASLEINGGKIEQKHFIAVKNDDFGKITVTGGTITSDDQAIQNWTEVSVTGGAINGKVVTWAYTGGAASKTEIAGDVDITGNVMAVNYDGGKTIPTVSITGGKITGEVQKGEYKNNSIVLTDPDATSSDISITGGTFSTNPGKYIADGYLADKTEDGYQIIKEGDATENVALAGKTYYPTLKEAIDAAEAGDTVTLLKDITVDMGDKDAAAIAIKKDLTLDGNGKTIAANKSGAEEGMGHILGIQGANVKVRDLTIDGTDKSARHAIQVYGKGSNATLYSVTVKNCFGYGLVVNGATATATRLTTDGNGWGGVNVTKGVNITDNPSFTLNSGTLTDENPIQIDVDVKAGDLDADWVTFGEGAGEWDIITDAETGDGRPAIQWKPAKGEAVAQVNGSNYATLEAAIKAAKEGATVKLLKDIEFSVDRETDKNTSLIEINKDLTLDGNGRTITVKGNVTEGKGHVIGILDGANVTVTDLTIDGGKAARHGIQTYINGSKATLQNVTVKNCLGYGVVANGSTIIADELYTSGNAWGGVNVSKGSGVKEEPKFVFNGGKLKAEVEGTAPIQIDNVDTTEPINENWVQFGENEEGNWHYEKIGETKIHWLEGAPIESITLNTESIKLEVGDKAQLIATVLPENAYNKDVAWSVPEGTKAIEVDADTGVVTALEKAVAVEVTATAKNGKTATCQVSVNEDADETTTLTVQPSVTDTTMNADDIVTAINNADDADEILVDVPNGTNNVISKDVFAAAKERKAGKLIIKTENATFTFDADQIENAADVNVGITTVPKEKVDVDEWLPGATTEAIELTHGGNFPAPATITYTLTDITGVDTVYLYYYNDGALELMAQDALTVADNSVTFTLAHASAYVFSTEPIEATTVANDIEKAIEAIGTVTYGDETKAAIKKAREQYDLFAKLYPEDTDKVGNLDTLTAAEAAYKALDDEVQAFKAEFDAFYDKVKDGGVMSYEEQQQVPKLRAAFEALDDSQKKALEAYEQDLQTVEDICKASQEGEIVSQANRVSKAVAEKLPTNVAFTTAVKSQIDAVRALYDSVVAETPDAKVLLTSELAAIEKAEAAYKTAKRAAYSSAKISLSTTKYTYNGKAKRPTVKGLSAFVNGTDYTITYKSNVKSGKATVTGKGDCAGFSAKTATFRIVPNKAAISKLTKGKRNMKVRIKSQKKAAVSGYQIAYKYGKSGKYKKVTTTKLTKKIRKLKTKKYYYVKVRAYKKIDGKKYYGTYSKIKKIKVR
ncbi:Ig-like domain-containing protein [Zhenpiania hominis]|uniref:Ig-like domain-containing protein n=1 Tax=Zhenpiania hominis TaxID=2763644 RepID=UPI0039F577D7